MTKKNFLLIKFISFITLFFMISETNVYAGPLVVPHPKSNDRVQIVNYETGVELEFSDVTHISLFQEMFRRAKRVGDTTSHLSKATHKIRFANTWLIDLNNGEIQMLKKQVSDVYILESEDLNTLQKIIQTRQNKTSSN